MDFKVISQLLMYNHLNQCKFYSPSQSESSSSGNKLIRAGIIGGAGYTGGELIRLLINHPFVDIAFVNSKSNAGNLVSSVHTDVLGETDLTFSADINGDIDVLFLCVGHGDAQKFLDEKSTTFKAVKLIDLSHDYRLHQNGQRAIVNDHPFIYGLPELNKDEIISANNIANPGCFATAIQLGLLPLAKAGLLKEIYTTGITGSTGAGQALSPTTHFSYRSNNISAYKTLTHQHLKEIVQSLQQLQPSFSPTEVGDGEASLYFVPWRGDFTRGIYISSTTNCSLSLEEVNNLYREYYSHSPFTYVSEKIIDLKQVVNTNKGLIHIEKAGSKVVIHSAIDNLLKGASGQAVQNMNLMFGLDECSGLRLKAGVF
jgi:N-acetyl-gamma-glutamyl-phosphate reductase